MKWEYTRFKRTKLSPRIIYFLPTITFWQDTKGRPSPAESQLSFNWLVWQITLLIG